MLGLEPRLPLTSGSRPGGRARCVSTVAAAALARLALAQLRGLAERGGRGGLAVHLRYHGDVRVALLDLALLLRRRVDRVGLLVAVLAGQRHGRGAQFGDVAGLKAFGGVPAVAVRDHEVAVQRLAQRGHPAEATGPAVGAAESAAARTAWSAALLGGGVGAARSRPDRRATAGRDHHRDPGRDRGLAPGPGFL